MKTSAALVVALCGSANAYAPHAKSNMKPTKPTFDLKKAATATFTAATIASSAFAPMAEALDLTPTNFGSSQIIAEKVVREGVYKDYEIDLTGQTVDNAESSFKSAKETKSKKGMSSRKVSPLLFHYSVEMSSFAFYS